MFSTSTKFLMIMSLVFGLNAILTAQECRLNCQDHVYISLDENCEHVLTYQDVLKNPDCPPSLLTVIVYDKYGNPIPGNLLQSYHRGQKLTYKVSQVIDGTTNSCWGYVTPEDKWAPIIECVDDTLNCWDALEFLDANPLEDNCGYDLEINEIGKKWVSYDCDSADFVGYIERSLITVDTWGNVSRCDSQRIYVIREYLDSLVCPDSVVTLECCDYDELDSGGNPIYKLWHPDYVYEDDYGYSHPIAKPGGLVEPPYIATDDGPHYIHKSNSNGKCNVLMDYKDHIIPTCGHSYKIRREYKIFDWCTGRDTLCIQWIKILDTMAPEIKVVNPSDPYKTVCLDGRDYEWNDDCETVEAVDISTGRTYTVNSHDCKVHVTLDRPEITKECGFLFAKGDEEKLLEENRKIKVSYLIRYRDYWSENHEYRVLTGDIPYGEQAHVYLPAGWYQVIYFVKDECWNTSYACEEILVHDIIPPTPVCDEITQVTLDPEKCWTRVYAEDLDDGSNDNCAHKLHYAVAQMDSIEYYRNYWKEQLMECHDEYEFNHHYDLFHELIENWINCYVFNDYIDLSECGTEQVVLRVYEADGLPLYDPHIFKGTLHQWFCYNLYDDYACWFGWNYDAFAHYENPVPDLCDYELEGSELEGYYSLRHKKIQYYDWNCSGPCGILDAEDLVLGGKPSHGAQPNPVCCTYMMDGDNDNPDWLALVEKYPELYNLHCKRWTFQHLYNDCMIEVIKDDKTPPICIAPANAVYYCDGVPEVGNFYPNDGNDIFCWVSARFAHDICFESDIWDANCRFDDPNDGGDHDCAGSTGPGTWCVAAPWDGAVHGYYAGPSSDGYYYDDPCDNDLGDWYPEHYSWKPIYCRFWLMLDKYDATEGDGKPNPYDYFGDVTVDENCWKYTVDTIDAGELDECGVGILTRTWIVTDNCGNTSSCYQQIAIKPRSDFEVKFPEDKEVFCDELEDLSPVEGDPESYPVVTDDDCELIGITYADQILDINEEGCYKILRTWKVIDWCVYVPDIHNRYPDVIVDDRCVAHPDKRPCVIRNLKDDGDGFMTYLQVITVVDDEAPVVTCNDIEVCIYDENCEEAPVDTLIGEATDNCTEELQYRYTIKPDGSEDPATWVHGHGNILQNTLPVGEHVGILYARDDCGNEGYC